MDINLLTLDVGNSRLAVGAFVAGELKFTARVPHDRRQDWAPTLRQAWESLADRETAGVAGASVNPGLIESLEHTVMEVTKTPVEWVGRDIDLPIKVLTDVPAQTGVDRIVNIAAAFEQMGKACIVVGAGTAITIDCCDDAGNFLGGAIAPGVSLRLASLHEKTAKLPLVDFAIPEGAFGRSTEQAILHGVYYGIRGMVKELAENYATELGRWPDIIATGGDAKRLFGDWELIHAVAPDLTLYGIALAYTNHYIKHQD